MGENMNGHKYFYVIVRVGLAWNGKQVQSTLLDGAHLQLFMRCSAMEDPYVLFIRPYFCGYMLFNSWI